MGLYNFPSPAEGLLPLLVMNTVLSVALLKNMVRYVVQVVVGASGSRSSSPTFLEDDEQSSDEEDCPPPMSDTSGRARRRVVSITRFKSSCGGDDNMMECCVCLCRFEGNEEVSELSCKHFFHKGCLEKWFQNQHRTCPLCRSIL